MKTRFAGLAILLGLFSLGCGERPLAEFHSPAGKFKVMFPGSPKEVTTKGKNNVQVHVLTVESSSWAYIITYYDSPAPLAQDAEFARKALPMEAEGVFAGTNGKKASQNFIKLQDKYEGIEYTGTVGKPLSGQLRGRSYIVGNRVYNAFVVGTAEKINGETANGFFDSFKVDP